MSPTPLSCESEHAIKTRWAATSSWLQQRRHSPNNLIRNSSRRFCLRTKKRCQSLFLRWSLFPTWLSLSLSPMNCNPETLLAKELSLLQPDEEEASEHASTASGSGSHSVEIVDEDPHDLLSWFLGLPSSIHSSFWKFKCCWVSHAVMHIVYKTKTKQSVIFLLWPGVMQCIHAILSRSSSPNGKPSPMSRTCKRGRQPVLACSDWATGALKLSLSLSIGS